MCHHRQHLGPRDPQANLNSLTRRESGIGKIETTDPQAKSFFCQRDVSSFHQSLHSSGCRGRRLFALLASLGFALAFTLFLGFEVFVNRRPKAIEKVVERTTSGIVKIKTAKNGVDRGTFHFVDPFRQSHLRIGYEENEEGTQQGSRISRQGTPIRVGIVKQSRDGRKIRHPEFGGKRPILVNDYDAGSVIRAKLMVNKSLVIRTGNEYRFHE